MDSICHFRVTLINDVLVKILWVDYFPGLSSADRDLPSSKKTADTSIIKHPDGYLLDLRGCVIQILSGIFLLERDLLSAFCSAFQESCLSLFQPITDMGYSAENGERLVQFIILIGKHAMQKDETWPLALLVGPMLANTFPLIRSRVSKF